MDRSRLAATASALSILGIVPHALEDFDRGIPERFGVSPEAGASALALALTLQALAMIGSSSIGVARTTSLVALATIGAGWTFAAIIDHPSAFTTTPFRDGLESRLAVWLIVVPQLIAVVLAIRALIPTTTPADRSTT